MDIDGEKFVFVAELGNDIIVIDKNGKYWSYGSTEDGKGSKKQIVTIENDEFTIAEFQLYGDKLVVKNKEGEYFVYSFVEDEEQYSDSVEGGEGGRHLVYRVKENKRLNVYSRKYQAMKMAQLLDSNNSSR